MPGTWARKCIEKTMESVSPEMAKR